MDLLVRKEVRFLAIKKGIHLDDAQDLQAKAPALSLALPFLPPYNDNGATEVRSPPVAGLYIILAK